MRQKKCNIAFSTLTISSSFIKKKIKFWKMNTPDDLLEWLFTALVRS